MGIRTLKPTSPARRYMTQLTNEEITKKTPEKSLLSPKKRGSGRNVYGRITVRHRGGGAKRMLRDVDFRREKIGIPAVVAGIEYDPGRSARIALLHYKDGEKRYIIAPLGLKPGDMVMSGPQADILPGNALPIRNIPLGTLVHNVELQPGKGGQLCRSAGTLAQLLAKEGDHANLKLPSGEVAVVDGLGVTDGKTKTLMGRLKGLGLPVAPTLLVVSERTDALGRAARNVPWLAVETPAHASVYQVIRHERVVFEKAALLSLQEALA